MVSLFRKCGQLVNNRYKVYYYFYILYCNLLYCKNLAIFCQCESENSEKKEKKKVSPRSDQIELPWRGEKGGFTFPSIGYED